MKIYQKALGVSLFQYVQRQVLDGRFPWCYQRTTAYWDDPNPTDQRDSSFSHLLMEGEDFQSPYNTLFYTMTLAMFDQIKEPCQQIWRMRLGLVPMTSEPYEHKPHVDFFGPHKTALFCFSGDSGPTNFFEQTFQEGDNPETMDFKKVRSVEPLENQAIVFDGLQYHSSTTPTNPKRRVMLTVNFC